MATFAELTGPDYVAGLESLSTTEVRAKRDECQRMAEIFSYLRRQIQGRLDIVHADLERRAGGEPGDLAALIEQLKSGKILRDRERPAGYGRLVARMDAVDENGWIGQEMEQALPAGRLSELPELSDDEVANFADALAALERKVSERRARLHERTDELQAELVRRYKTGEATVDSLLG